MMGGCKGADTAQSASGPSLAAKEEGKESSENEESKNEQPASEQSGEKVHLKWAVKASEAGRAEFEEMAAMAEEACNVDIEIIALPDPGAGEANKLLISLMAGDEFDIVEDAYSNMKQFYEAGVIEELPDKNYLNDGLRINQILDYFHDFYDNFDLNKAYEMLKRLNIDPKSRLKTLSKGTKEKVQLILVMSRNADLYLLDEPIGGVDPAARDYILNTILSNYNEQGSIIISTHLISDIEPVLDDIIFIKDGTIVLTSSVDAIREENGKSVDALFREVFKC